MTFLNDTVGEIVRRASEPVTSGPEAPAGRCSVRLIDDGERVEVRSPYDPSVTQAFRQIFGRRWDGTANLFPVEALPQVVALLDGAGLVGIGDDVRDLADAEAQRQAVEEADSAVRRAASEAVDADLTVDGLGGTLMPFQRAGVAYAIERRRVIIGDEMGLGKTVEALAALQAEEMFPAVVVCPASLKINWQRETERWLPGRTIEVLSGTRAEARLVQADVTIVNYDIVHAWGPVLEPRALILDESHYCKSGRARRTKAARELAGRIERSGMVLALTGTAVVNRPDELLPQLQIIGRISAFGGARQFRRDFCSFDGWGWNGSHHERELHQRLRETCYVRRTKAQVLTDLPPKRWADVSLDPNGLDLREYAAAERDLIRFLAEAARLDAAPGQGDAAAASAARRARAAEALVRLTTLRRLAAVAKAPAAIEWARGLVDEGQKVVIFAHHREALVALADALDAPLIVGGQSAEARQAAVDRFQDDDDCPVIVSSIKAGGVGITLTAASNVAFVEQDWTPAGMSQAADRCHRIGQTDSVTAWILQVPGTIDERMAALLAEKRVVVDAILDGVEATEVDAPGSVVNDLLADYLKES